MRNSRNLSKIILSFFFLALALNATAQSQSELESRRKKLINEIDQTTRLLNTAKRNKEAALDRYLTLQKQIDKRQILIKTLEKELELTDKSITRTNIAIEAMNSDVDRLKEEYGQMMRMAYKQKLNNSALLFIFSSGSFNEAFRRYKYLQQYDAYRRKQALLIIETQQTLLDKGQQLEVKRGEKESLLQSSKTQNNLLSKELVTSDELLSTLKKDESRLTFDLKKKKKSREKLNTAIEGIIKGEMASRLKKTRKPRPSKEEKIEETELISLTGGFEKNKGGLGMPANGVVTKYFGKQKHPTIKNIVIDNPGIDIKTEKGAVVRAVYKGEVVGVQFVPGSNYMVLLKHGDYYTVYSNLTELEVKRNEKVASRQVLGKVSTDRITNTSMVHFEVWREKKRLNPILWVKR